ncbi:GAF and ANTAR domain-containing protein [Streptomyces sp. HNM0663]|uniref:GAF and ANTAR domain-containing protein n=1 Tax=Streptomyces chengmaiensis TaxID=3040919 RepID=A0ABT6HNF7_9ACTN|nr:GAF and ANTAR domain-containing protein [Streptomyces chengmaiensis]MDH2390237.1 GAF and ANTAR domain-containing protein [Streptomyces chengmaiensis]
MPSPPVPEPTAAARELSQFTREAMQCADASCGAVATLTGEGGDLRTTATHPDLTALLSVEMASGEGPTPAALDAGETVSAQDLLTEERWPDYRAVALDSGLRSSVTMPFSRDELDVTLSLYSFRPRAFGEGVQQSVHLLGEYFAEGLARDHSCRAALAEVDQLETALESRAVIDQACGIVMHVTEGDAREAFGILRRISQRTNRKLAEVADEVVRRRGRGLEAELRALAGASGRSPACSDEAVRTSARSR